MRNGTPDPGSAADNNGGASGQVKFRKTHKRVKKTVVKRSAERGITTLLMLCSLEYAVKRCQVAEMLDFIDSHARMLQNLPFPTNFSKQYLRLIGQTNYYRN